MRNAVFAQFLLQLCFALLAVAAPASDPAVGTAAHGNTWQYGTGGGILGFIVLVLDIIVFRESPSKQRPRRPIEVLKSDRPVSHKVLWCLVVFLFPIVGMVIYWLFSNRAAHNSRSGYEAVA
ncbi:hypothetical protein CLIM01_06459 [Colletotrichum limetticola]|uniref:Cardiolipin synthase N-terminal domain-containing protein n=1 Tax=Colletotrichum limetticola TaxID=1209924 RepID=A0ABQ9PXM9_9PEZI|nr:hypothetical protein CLIM01_06459 [Colletotrichum limetticola]